MAIEKTRSLNRRRESIGSLAFIWILIKRAKRRMDPVRSPIVGREIHGKADPASDKPKNIGIIAVIKVMIPG
jgi:hypothetical protein